MHGKTRRTALRWKYRRNRHRWSGVVRNIADTHESISAVGENDPQRYRHRLGSSRRCNISRKLHDQELQAKLRADGTRNKISADVVLRIRCASKTKYDCWLESADICR